MRILEDSTLLRLALTLLILYVGFLILIALVQKKLTYFPSRGPETELIGIARGLGLRPWRNAGGEVVVWRSGNGGGGAARMIVFHGNGGMALDRAAFVRGLEGLESGRLWEVFLFEYPGYGARHGMSSERAFVEAAESAVMELASLDGRPVFLTGESLGSGVACQVAARNQDLVKGLFLVTPFTTLVEVASHHYSLVPVSWLLRDKYDNVTALREFRGPIAFLFAGRDEVVPSAISRHLYDSYGGPRRFWTQEEATHNTMLYGAEQEMWREVSEFLLEEGLKRD